MDFSKFAYEDYMFMINSPNESIYYNRKICLGAECAEKLLKHLITLETNKEPSKSHSQVSLLRVLLDNDKYTKLKKYRALGAQLTDAYFTRRYPGEGYFDLNKEEFEELYFDLLDYIKDLVYFLEEDSIFRKLLYN